MKRIHSYVLVVERLKREEYRVEFIFFNEVPIIKLSYYQVQEDAVVDMLTSGWFGANVHEGMMLGKPTVCFLPPERLEHARKQVPECVREVPVISATPSDVYDVLKDLAENPEKSGEICERSREFAIK